MRNKIYTTVHIEFKLNKKNIWEQCSHIDTSEFKKFASKNYLI